MGVVDDAGVLERTGKIEKDGGRKVCNIGLPRATQLAYAPPDLCTPHSLSGDHESVVFLLSLGRGRCAPAHRPDTHPFSFVSPNSVILYS